MMIDGKQPHEKENRTQEIDGATGQGWRLVMNWVPLTCLILGAYNHGVKLHEISW
jgi:hypothetical protein